MGEAPHKKYLNDWFTGKWPGSPSRGELYNDSEVLRDARLCGTTASLCGIESALYEGDEEALKRGIAADLMLHAWMLTLKGIPVIYSGDEIGMLNDYDYHNDPKKWADSRYIHRGDFRWDMAEQRNDETSVTGILFHEITRLSKIKKENEVFHSDAHLYCFDTGDRRVLGVKREYNGETLLGLFNFSEEHCRTEIESADWHDLTEPDRNYIRGESKTTEYWIEPYGFRWFVK